MVKVANRATKQPKYSTNCLYRWLYGLYRGVKMENEIYIPLQINNASANPLNVAKINSTEVLLLDPIEFFAKFSNASSIFRNEELKRH